MGRPDVGFIFFEEHNDSHAPANLSVFPAKQFDAHAVGRMHEGNARRRVDIRGLQAELNPFTAQVRTEAVEIGLGRGNSGGMACHSGGVHHAKH